MGSMRKNAFLVLVWFLDRPERKYNSDVFLVYGWFPI